MGLAGATGLDGSYGGLAEAAVHDCETLLRSIITVLTRINVPNGAAARLFH